MGKIVHRQQILAVGKILQTICAAEAEFTDKGRSFGWGVVVKEATCVRRKRDFLVIIVASEARYPAW